MLIRFCMPKLTSRGKRCNTSLPGSTRKLTRSRTVFAPKRLVTSLNSITPSSGVGQRPVQQALGELRHRSHLRVADLLRSAHLQEVSVMEKAHPVGDAVHRPGIAA